MAVHRAVCAAFPSITSYGTFRGGGGDHGSGRAIDIMVSGELRLAGRRLRPRALRRARRQLRHLRPAHLVAGAWRRGLARHGRPRLDHGQPLRPRARLDVLTASPAPTRPGPHLESRPAMDSTELYDAPRASGSSTEPPKRVDGARSARRSSGTGRGSCTPRRRGGWRPRPRCSGRGPTTSSATGSPTASRWRRWRATCPGRWAASPTSPRPRRWPTTSGTRRSATTASGCWPSCSEACGGFEGNAQTLRLLTRLEAKTFDADGRLGRAQPDPGHARRLHEVPVARAEPRSRGVHADGRRGVRSSACTTTTCRSSTGCATGARPGTRRCLEAQVMDLADDVAYSVHDVEDGVVAGRIDLTRARPRRRCGRRCATGTSPTRADDVLDEALAGLRRPASWPTTPYDGTRRGLAALKNLTSDLIGRFCGAVQRGDVRRGRRAVRPLPRRPGRARAARAWRSRCSRGSPPTT